MNEISNEKKNPVINVSLILLMLASSVALQLLCNYVFVRAAGTAAVRHYAAQGITDAAEIKRLAEGFLSDHIIWAVVLYHMTAPAVYGLIYWKMTKHCGLTRSRDLFTVRSAAGIITAGIGLQFLTTAGVDGAAFLVPEVIGRYEEVMEAAGLGALTPASVLASVVLAPIGEELLCRGIVLRLAGGVSGRFWAANCIQALVFGIMHFNLVQGTYAFLLGLALGMWYRRYRSLYAPMLAHLVINASSLLLVPAVLGDIPVTPGSCMAVMGMSALVTAAGAALCGRRKEEGNRAV